MNQLCLATPAATQQLSSQRLQQARQGLAWMILQLVALTGARSAGGGGGSSSNSSSSAMQICIIECMHSTSKACTSTTQHGMQTVALRLRQQVLLWPLHLRTHATMLLKPQQLRRSAGLMRLMRPSVSLWAQ
jgi:hypothetical protein